MCFYLLVSVFYFIFVGKLIILIDTDMEFKVMFSPFDIRVLEYDSFDDAVRFCMVQCKRFAVSSFMISYKFKNDKQKKCEYTCDLIRKQYVFQIRYAGLPFPLRSVIGELDMDLSFLDNVERVNFSHVVPDDFSF